MNNKNQIAKITRPAMSEIIPRKRLFCLLDERRKQSVTWVSAPGGSGKTSLIANYLDTRKLPCIWYQIDPGDADIASFFHYMSIASIKAAPLKRKPLPLFGAEYLSNLSAFTQSFFEELYSRLKQPYIIVLDNYQDLPQNSVLHEIMSRAFSIIPEGLNAIIISRNDPPQKFARLRANKVINIIEWDDIRFTIEETEELLRLGRSEPVNQEILNQIYEKTDGWVAGLVLLLEKAKKGNITIELMRNVARESIFDYFAAEIFENSDDQTKTLLLNTAFSQSTNPVLAKELTGIERSGQILSRLTADHFFTTKQKQSEAIYQYHPLFREFLLNRANETYTLEEVTNIQKKTAAALEKEGDFENAIDIYIRAQAWDETTKLICHQAQLFLQQGRTATVNKWIDRLPSEIIERTPYLLYWRAYCQIALDAQKSRTDFEAAFKKFKLINDRTGMFLAWAAIADISIHSPGGINKWISVLNKILKEDSSFPSEEIEAKVSMSVFNGMSMKHSDHPEMPKWEEKAFHFCFNKKIDIMSRVTTAVYLRIFHIWMGNTGKMTVLMDFLRGAAQSGNLSDLQLLTIKTTEVMTDLFMGDCTACISKVEEALRFSEQTGVHLWDCHLLCHATSAALSDGDMRTADLFLKRLEAVIDEGRIFDKAYYHALAGWRSMLNGDHANALGHLELMLKIAIETNFTATISAAYLIIADVFHNMRKNREAMDYLAKAFKIARRMKSKLLEYMCFLSESKMHFDKGSTEKTLSCLRRAMAIGRENGLVNFISWRRPVMIQLCMDALNADIEIDYVQGLIKKRNLIPEIPPIEIDNWPWHLKIYTFGDFALKKEDKPIDISKNSGKPLDILKILIALGGQGVSEEKITDALWPEAEGDAAHSAFSTTLLRLRKIIGDDAVIMRGGRLSINKAYCWVDIHVFNHTLELMGKKANHNESARYIEKLVKLYRGPFMKNEPDSITFSALREQLRSKLLSCISGCSNFLVTNGHYERAIGLYQKGLELDDLSEDFYRGLMVCYLKLGNRSKGLLIYRRCKNMLSRSFDIKPSRETEEALSALKKH